MRRIDTFKKKLPIRLVHAPVLLWILCLKPAFAGPEAPTSGGICALVLGRLQQVNFDRQRGDLESFRFKHEDYLKKLSHAELTLDARLQTVLNNDRASPRFYPDIQKLLTDLEFFNFKGANLNRKKIALTELRTKVLKLGVANSAHFPSSRLHILFVQGQSFSFRDAELREFLIRQSILTPPEGDLAFSVWMETYNKIMVEEDAALSGQEVAILTNALASQVPHEVVNAKDMVLRHLTRKDLTSRQFQNILALADELEDFTMVDSLIAFTKDTYRKEITTYLKRVVRLNARDDDTAHPMRPRALDRLFEFGSGPIISKTLCQARLRGDLAGLRSALQRVTDPRALSRAVGEDVVIAYLFLLEKSSTAEDFSSINWRRDGWALHFKDGFDTTVLKIMETKLFKDESIAISAMAAGTALGRSSKLVSLALDRAIFSDSLKLKREVFLRTIKDRLNLPDRKRAVDLGIYLTTELNGPALWRCFSRIFNQWDGVELTTHQMDILFRTYDEARRQADFPDGLNKLYDAFLAR